MSVGPKCTERLAKSDLEVFALIGANERKGHQSMAVLAEARRSRLVALENPIGKLDAMSNYPASTKPATTARWHAERQLHRFCWW
jgi:hypothetical protein